MRPLRRRTRFEKVIKAAQDADVASAVRRAVPDVDAPKAVKSGATAVVAATAASAAISALRRRLDEDDGDR